MQVFKTFFKVIQKNLTQIVIYFFVFLFLSVLMVGQSNKNSPVSFESTKTNMAIFNYDKNSEFSNNLEKFISNYADIKEINDTTEDIQDALFYRDVEYIIRIPNGFGNKFLNNDSTAQLEKISTSDSYTATYMDSVINNYLNFTKKYKNNITNISYEKLQQLVNCDMQLEANVHINSYGKENDSSTTTYYFTFFAYAIFAIMIQGITSIMLTFNNLDIRKRTFVSPIKLYKYNFQLILGCFAFTVIIWALISFLSIAIYGIDIINKQLGLLFINSFVLSIVALSVSFLVSNFIKSKSSQSSVSTILSLGLSFISGVFVKQEYMSPSVLKIASFTPTYWYVKNVNDIKNLTIWSNENLMPIIYGFLIQFGFAIAILTIALVIIKQRKTSNN
jgi:ABC-2 type transport system permease protein